MTSLDCLVFAAGCVEDPNPAKSSKSPKAEVTHWEELAFCGYKRDKSDKSEILFQMFQHLWEYRHKQMQSI